MNEVNSEGISQNLTHISIPHFNTSLYQTRSEIPARLNSHSDPISRLLFQSTQMIHIEHRDHWDRSHIFWIYSHSRRIYSRLRLDYSLLFFQRSYDILTYIKDVPITSFVWRCRFDFMKGTKSYASVYCRNIVGPVFFVFHSLHSSNSSTR